MCKCDVSVINGKLNYRLEQDNVSSPKHSDPLVRPLSIQWVPAFFPGGKTVGA
jgi:hypothetical protein